MPVLAKFQPFIVIIYKMMVLKIKEFSNHFFPSVPVPEPLGPVPSSLKKASSIKESFCEIIFSAYFFELSIIKPPIIISSRMK